VALDGWGNVYVADTWNDRIQKFTSDGVFITKWGKEGSGDGEFRWPAGVAVDASGNVYVADTKNHRIQKFTSDGIFIAKWGSKGTGKGEFFHPTGVAVDASGNAYVADSGNHRIQKFRPEGIGIISIAIEHRNPSWTRLTWPVIPEKSYKIYWTDDLATGTLHWDEVDGAALDDLIDNGDGTQSWTDKGTDPDMGGNAPGDVPNRFYIIAAE